MAERGEQKSEIPCIQAGIARFMLPSLLLLLQRQKSHGYELMEKLRVLGFEGTSSDMATLYRTLRQLEDMGMVVSEWEEGSQGPPKRVYALTDDGRCYLHDWIPVVKANKDRLAKFLEIYES